MSLQLWLAFLLVSTHLVNLFKGQNFTLVEFQWHVSQLQKDVSIWIEHFFVFTTTANLFEAEICVTEIRQESKIWPKGYGLANYVLPIYGLPIYDLAIYGLGPVLKNFLQP